LYWYLMIGDPPSVAGVVHDNVTDVDETSDTSTPTGAEGVSGRESQLEVRLLVAVGMVEAVVVPFPICPDSFAPQHWIDRFSSTAHIE